MHTRTSDALAQCPENESAGRQFGTLSGREDLLVGGGELTRTADFHDANVYVSPFLIRLFPSLGLVATF